MDNHKFWHKNYLLLLYIFRNISNPLFIKKPKHKVLKILPIPIFAINNNEKTANIKSIKILALKIEILNLFFMDINKKSLG